MKQSHGCRTREPSNPNDWLRTRLLRLNFIAVCRDETEDRAQQPGIWGMSPKVARQRVSRVSPGLQA